MHNPLAIALAAAALGAACGGPAPEPESAAPAEAVALAAPLDEERALYSQSREELIIRDFFGDRRDGVYLDVGCAWAEQYSNTYYLEQHLGWTGIGVDALPDYAEGWAEKRPRSRFFNFLVTDHSDTEESFFRADLMGISQVQGPVVGPAGDVIPSEEIQVPTITLTQLLDHNEIEKIDLLNLDIEGHEPMALAGFDIDRFRPELVCVEAKPQNREFLKQYFADHGYVQLERYLEHDQTNYYFTPRSEPEGDTA
jgi:FkbM family methyltransferase